MSLRHWAIAATLAIGSAAITFAIWVDVEGGEGTLAVGRLFFHLNDTDSNLSIHADIDGEAWQKVTIEAPVERKIAIVDVRGRLQQQGITKLAFESAAPGLDELSPEEFFFRFPEGLYEIEGITFAGKELEKEVQVTHVLPAPASNVLISGHNAPQNCNKAPIPKVAEPIDITWDPVTRSHPEIGKPGSINIVSYEVAIERITPAAPIMTVNLPATVTQLEIPSDLMMSGEMFKFQLLAKDIGGNETGTESCFVVST